jgi:ankyrin repeat protein
MRERLEHLPVDELTAYSEIMARITKDESSKKIILRILSWIRYSQRLLSINELREVIWVEQGDKDLKRKNIDGLELDDIIKNCESLVTCDKTTRQVRFCHATVQEFLDKRFACELMTHTDLAKTCLTYLNFDVFGVSSVDHESIKERRETYAFSDYAASYWAVHAGRANSGDGKGSDVQLAIVDTFRENGKRESMVQFKDCRNWYDAVISRKSFLHILVESGLAFNCMPPISDTYVLLFEWWLTKSISNLLQQQSIDVADSKGWTALHYAAEGGQLEVVKWLIEMNANVNAAENDGGTALHLAAARGHKTVVMELLNRQANIDVTDKLQRTALHYAAKGGHKEVGQILVDRGAKVDEADGWLNTALIYATWNRDTKMVKMLSDVKAGTEQMNFEGRTALLSAAESGDPDLVRALLEAGAIVDRQIGQSADPMAPIGAVRIDGRALGGVGRTALHVAAHNGDLEIVRMLLSRNANVSIKDFMGSTALYLAVLNEQAETVRALVEAGADGYTTK